MAANPEKHGQSDHLQKLRENGNAGVEGRIEDVGQLHPRHLPNDMSGELQTAEEEHHPHTNGQSNDGLLAKQRDHLQ